MLYAEMSDREDDKGTDTALTRDLRCCDSGEILRTLTIDCKKRFNRKRLWMMLIIFLHIVTLKAVYDFRVFVYGYLCNL